MHGLRHKLLFAGGIAVVLAAILPPLGIWGQELFSMHMAQHLLLIVIAAPLLVLSRGFPGWDRSPLAAWLTFVGVFLIWHWPAAFQWAALRQSTRLLEEGSILVAAMLFWSVALSPKGQAWLSYGARALFVMTAAVTTDLPGVLMVFAPRDFCTLPGGDALRWGLTPLQDQQIAGLLMWVPANIIFFGFATWLFAQWIREPQKLSQVPP